MNLEFELRRAETVRLAVERAGTEFRRFFETHGMESDPDNPFAVRRSHLRVTLAIESPHRIRLSFAHFWRQTDDLPAELLVTDDEKVFWMNTATNREYMTFGELLAAAVETKRT